MTATEKPQIVQTFRKSVKNSVPRTWGIDPAGNIYLLSRHRAGWQPVNAVAGRFGVDKVTPPAEVIAAAEERRAGA